MSARRKIGEERLYYSPPALRRQNQQQQLKLNSTPSKPERSELRSCSYLDRFLEHTTPAVPPGILPRLFYSQFNWGLKRLLNGGNVIENLS